MKRKELKVSTVKGITISMGLIFALVGIGVLALLIKNTTLFTLLAIALAIFIGLKANEIINDEEFINNIVEKANSTKKEDTDKYIDTDKYKEVIEEVRQITFRHSDEEIRKNNLYVVEYYDLITDDIDRIVEITDEIQDIINYYDKANNEEMKNFGVCIAKSVCDLTLELIQVRDNVIRIVVENGIMTLEELTSGYVVNEDMQGE